MSILFFYVFFYVLRIDSLFIYRMEEQVNQFTLWEEKNSTDHKTNLIKNEENGRCVTTGETPKKSEEKILKGIGGIYKIVNKINGKYYVGSTVNFRKRWIAHKYLLNANRHHNVKLQYAWNKYGESSFDFILETVSDDSDLLRAEQSYLDVAKLNAGGCYNLSFDAMAPWRDKKLSESHRRNVSLALKGKPKSKEHNRKVGLANRGKPNGRTNLTVVKFVNNLTGESFSGIKIDFCKLHGIDPRKAYDLLKGNRKTHKGWSVPL